MRRVFLALFLSLAFHAGCMAVALGVGIFRNRVALPSLTFTSIDVEVKSLPLGNPPGRVTPQRGAPSQAKRSPPPKVTKTGTGVILPTDGGIDALPTDSGSRSDAEKASDAEQKKPGDLRNYGPDGSTLIAILRFDRLRQSPAKDRYIAAVDQLLQHLPDRHRLVEGTGLDLYQDFKTLLIATPDPTNAAVTFLAARHNLSDQALRKALDRGAKALGQVVEWKQIGGRPVGIRRQAKNSPSTSWGRDDRIFILPEPSLAIMATPAHAKILLGQDFSNPSQQQAPSGAKNRTPSTPSSQGSSSQNSWKDLVAKIDAENGAMPETAVFMMVANNLFSTTTPGETNSPERVETRPIQIVGGFPGQLPRVVTLVASIDPTPSIDLTADFPQETDARLWEQALPTWRRKAMLHPLLLLMGFANMIGRIEVTEDSRPLTVHLDLTADELKRLLTLIANLNRRAF